ncbi:hypothetical protein KIW84_023702 [Lathyrus oleraceus]|uniref:Uncharacterized protein n=1 Tax=Pisum sativum TaxID=3888 RepID=A0A9D4YI60_PEA|nr:hypothetical protein KIW84_023702 [Pisum sativum]
MHSDRNALVTVRDGVQGRDECEDLQQQQFFEFSDPEANDTVVPAPTVAQNNVVNNGRPVRQRALPHRLRDYERFQDNEVNNDGDFIHFALMAEFEPRNSDGAFVQDNEKVKEARYFGKHPLVVFIVDFETHIKESTSDDEHTLWRPLVVKAIMMILRPVPDGDFVSIQIDDISSP